MIQCDCGSTGGCKKCNPFQEFWKEDIEMAEWRMDEYNEGLMKIDDPEIPLCKDLKAFYKKR